MSYKIETTDRFNKEVKWLSKRHRSIKSDLTVLREILLENPFSGSSLGKNCYKIRLPIASKEKGKSGGARVVTHIKIVENTVYLLSIYDKSDKEDLEQGELDTFLDAIQ